MPNLRLISQGRDHMDDPIMEEEENWSDDATKTEEPRVSRSTRKSRTSPRRPRYYQSPHTPEAVNEAWTKTPNRAFESSRFRPRFHSGEISYGLNHPRGPPTQVTQPPTVSNSYFQKPQPETSYVDPNIPRPYRYYEYPNDPYQATAYPSYPAPREANSYHTSSYRPQPHTPSYAPGQANSYPTYQISPEPVIPPHASGHQTKPSTNPNFHIEYELEETRREMAALKMKVERQDKDKDLRTAKKIHAARRSESRRENKRREQKYR
ncbi:hypothetical protein BJ875DRAFT_444923 [Amylocarpus encephaloides]|uniref:Uncharacterized protein n=1 Tax=Amylocarpus encephaloides TaxID=45428 RepID=A0A9P7YC34_9HELO|nr:hypothetical protein BJ875DRAFT_444923 [Amylocarpus encephaloides]